MIAPTSDAMLRLLVASMISLQVQWRNKNIYCIIFATVRNMPNQIQYQYYILMAGNRKY